MPNRLVYEDRYFLVTAPERPLNSREDGGHLRMNKKVEVADRSDMSYQEAIDYMRISMMVGRAMYDVLGVERMNYEDLGNWSVDKPGGPKMHLHFFGRARQQTHQIRGHHMFLYPKGHPIYQGHLASLTDDEITRLRVRIEELSREEKYVILARLAEI